MSWDQAKRRLRWLGVCVFGLLLVVQTAAPLLGQDAGNSSLSGRIRDSGGAAMSSVIVQLLGGGSVQPRTTETNDLGYFRFAELPEGTYQVSAQHLGYETQNAEVRVPGEQAATLDLVLEIAPLALQGLEVEVEQSRERARFEQQVGDTRRELAGAEMKLVPGAGESDPIRAVEVLPGVVSTSDFSAAFNVRGGSADQNLILLDGVPIYNPFHLGGLFSVFNADMVARAELLSGGFPAEYGGRVSSVLNVESDAGTGTFQADAGISLLAARLSVAGGAPDGVTQALGLQTLRWRVSGRRSYFDQLSEVFPYHLTDGQAVLEAWTKGGSRLQVTGYSGRDVLDLREETSSGDSLDIPFEIDWRWGNDAIGGRWTTPKAGGGFVEARTSYSRFKNQLTFPEDDVTFGTAINAFNSAIDVEERIGSRWRLRAGVGSERTGYDNLLEADGATFQDVGGRGWLHGGYVQARWGDSRWLFEAGARVDHWRPEVGNALWEPAPRLAIKRFFGDRSSALKVAAGRYTQFLHSLRDEELPVGIDTWVLSGEQAPAVVSDQIQLGYERYFGDDWFASIEGYGRHFDGVTTVNNGEDPNDPTDDLLRGDGTSYGADLFVRKSGEGTTGWISISWLKANRTFPDYLSGLVPAPSLSAPPIFDRRLDIDLVLRYDLPWGVQSGLRWNLGTGLPYTRPIGKYGIYYPRGTAGGRLESSSYVEDDVREYDYGVVLGPKGGERYPIYHRLDVSFRKTLEKPWGIVTPHLDLLNVYNKRNPLFYFYDFEKAPPTRSGTSMFPILPTIGVEIRFR